MLGLQQTSRAALDLTSVQELLEYLFALPQSSEDRALNDEEDTEACRLLYVSILSCNAQCLREWADDCTAHSARSYRTLCVWYQIARSAAKYLEQHAYHCA